MPQSLSEQSVILALGLTHYDLARSAGWFEAGSAVGYVTHHALPDYRGGVSFARRFGQVVRYYGGRALSFRASTRISWSTTNRGSVRVTGPMQVYWNANVTFDVQRQYWANFVETGPGIRIYAACRHRM